MYKPSQNPTVTELEKTHRDRQYRLSDFKPIKTGTGRACIWCLATLGGNRQKWCSDDCIASALAWARPQTAHGLKVLLDRQNNACAGCQLDYRPYLAEALNKVRRWSWVQPTKFTERYMRAFRRLVPGASRPEVDHTVPIHLGGTAIGLDNHKVLCRKCHRTKTTAEMKARHEKHGSPIKGVKKAASHKKAMSESRKGFDSEARKAHRLLTYQANRKKVIATNIVTQEIRYFDSIEDAAKALDLQVSNVSRVANGKQGRKKHKGWTFAFQDDSVQMTNESLPKLATTKVQNSGPRKKKSK